jgi:hypothetical protein
MCGGVTVIIVTAIGAVGTIGTTITGITGTELLPRAGVASGAPAQLQQPSCNAGDRGCGIFIRSPIESIRSQAPRSATRPTAGYARGSVIVQSEASIAR